MWTDTQPIFIFSFIFIFYLLIFNLNNEVMKKYIAPELTVQLIQTEGLIALSIQSGKADDSEVLVKGSSDWDIFGEYADEEE